MRTLIKDRQEFDNSLLEAQAKMKQLIEKIRPEPVLISVLRQVEAIQQWTASGQDMSKDQKARIVTGLQTHREMASYTVEQDLVLALDNYIEGLMPTAPSPVIGTASGQSNPPIP
jgi:hypothetical protein